VEILVGIFVGTFIIIGVIIVAALDNLNANIATLKTDFEAYAAGKQGGANEAQVQAAADAVAAIDAEVKASQ
jgi:hypothetical protein